MGSLPRKSILKNSKDGLLSAHGDQVSNFHVDEPVLLQEFGQLFVAAHPQHVTSVHPDHKVRTNKEYHSVRPSSELGLPPTPHPQLVCPLPPVSGGRGTLAGEKGVGKVPIPTRGIHCGTLYMYVLCDPDPQSATWAYNKQGSQRDVVYLGWPMAPLYMSPNAGEEGVAGSQPINPAVHMEPKINFGDPTPNI